MTRFKIIICILVYYLLLNLSYTKIIAPNFYYMGYINNSPSIMVLIVSSVFAIIPSFWLPINITRASSVVCWILYLFVAIPVSFVPLYTLSLDPYNLIILEIFIMANVLLLSVFGKIKLVKTPKLAISNKSFWTLITGMSVLFYGYVFYKYGFNFNLAGLDDAYDLRFEYREEGDRISRYFINWQSKVINPFLIAIGLFYRRLPWLLIGFFGQVVLFSISGHKAYILTPFLILGLWIAFKGKNQKFGLRLVQGLALVVIMTFTIDVLLNSASLTSMFVRRMIVTPALLTGYYYDFFSQNPVAMWGHSFLKGVIDYPYALVPPFLIGLNYFGDPQIAANANLWADGIANFGFMGMFFNTIVLGILLWLFDSFSNHKSKVLMGMLLGVSAWNLADTALFTSILTHGIFLVVLIAFIMPDDIASIEKGKKRIRIVWDRK